MRWGNHSAFGAFEPVNEPWWNTPLEPLKDMYRQVRKLVQRYSPQAYFVFHDSFRYDENVWNDLFLEGDTDKTVLDHHYYWAFGQPPATIADVCASVKAETSRAKKFNVGEVWFGEWALATDNCAQHLNGFNDGVVNPQDKCGLMDCPRTYMPDGTGTDFDRTADILGPFGNSDNTKNSIQKGKCWTDSLQYNQDEVRQIANCAMDEFFTNLQGQFLWTAHNEIEARWDYIRAWDMMWINQTEVPEAQQKVYPDFEPRSLDTKDETIDLEFVQK